MLKKIEWLMCVLFVAIITIPALLAHREKGRISDMENRYYADAPSLFTDEGSFNQNICGDFDSWIEDNLRFRNTVMKVNANVQYKLFQRIVKEDEKANSEGELFFADKPKIEEYQHKNLLSDEELTIYLTQLENINQYLKNQEIDFYYLQCYEKESIYPEKYLEGINQLGDISKAQQVTQAIDEKTTVKQIPIYGTLMEHKNEGIYYRVLDSGHWNERGAFWGYTALIDKIKEDYSNIASASEEDYDIGLEESKRIIYGMEYPYPEKSMTYTIKNPKAVEKELEDVNPEMNQLIIYKEYTHYYENDEAGNDYRILLIGDSFVRQFIKDDVAEHFSKTLSIDWLNISQMDKVVKMYQPDIIVLESSEYMLTNTVPCISDVKFVGNVNN